MKKVLIWLLVLTMLLCGCAKEETPETSTTTQPQTTTTAPPEPERLPSGPYEHFYVPDSAVEKATNGAVKEYDMGDCYGVLTFGEGLLLLSGEDDTLLTYVKPDGSLADCELDELYLVPMDLTVLPENRLAYYDAARRAMIVLDDSLKEVKEISLPEAMEEPPVITSDGSRIYYLTTEQLRYLDVKSGIDKLLKEMSFPVQLIEELHFNDSLLECFTMDGDYIQSLLISTQTGQMIYSAEDMPFMTTSGENYFATIYEGSVAQYLFGKRDEKPSCLIAQGDVYLEAMQMQGVVSCEESEESVCLNYYDLVSGTRSSAVELPFAYLPYSLTEDVQNNAIWILMMDDDGKSKLYCWDLSQSKTGDITACVTPYYTRENPDRDGLADIADKAKALGQKYGIRIRVYEEAVSVQPSDYTFEKEYLVPVYRKYLAELEKALSQYPEGFLKKVGTTSGNGKITISLVKAAYGNNDLGSLDSADGVHFYDDGNVYIALVMKERFSPTLYHELFHSIDTYVLNHCNIYDDWEKLNPKGFRYDNDYVSNQFREDDQYLEEDRWFIDMYSMSYPKEDRARIMEYAMESGNEEYFESKNMQKKLSTLCKGIRTAFGLKKYSGVLPWEQYLG